MYEAALSADPQFSLRARRIEESPDGAGSYRKSESGIFM
jgi:hypothetical protein